MSFGGAALAQVSEALRLLTFAHFRRTRPRRNFRVLSFAEQAKPRRNFREAKVWPVWRLLALRASKRRAGFARVVHFCFAKVSRLAKVGESATAPEVRSGEAKSSPEGQADAQVSQFVEQERIF